MNPIRACAGPVLVQPVAIQRSLDRLAALVLVTLLALLPSCSAIMVDSNPRGADIVIDGGVSGFKTPRKFRVTQFGSGTHRITVQMPGYKTVTPEHVIEVTVSGGKIVMAVLLPVPFLFIGLGSGFKSWARATSMNFELEALPQATATELVPTKVPL